jgi:hypothetical protein
LGAQEHWSLWLLGLFCGRLGGGIPVEKVGKWRKRLHCDRLALLGLPWWLGWHEADLILEARYPDDSIPLLRYSRLHDRMERFIELLKTI